MNTVKIIKPDVKFITPIDGATILKLAWKLFYAETLKLREHYLMEQADDGWLARKKLKDIGCDIEEWYREEGGKTDA